MSRFSQPNFFTVNPDGSVSATFPGGITIPAATNSNPPAGRRIRWVRESNGAVVAEQYTSEDFSFQDSTNIRHHMTDVAKTQGRMNLQVVDDLNANVEAGIGLLAVRGVSPASNQVNVFTKGGDPAHQFQATVLDGDGASAFLQTITFGRFYASWGGANVFFNGAFNGLVDVNHGLGVLPSAVLLGPTMSSAGITAAIVFNVNTGVFNTNQFRLEGRTVNGAAIGPGNVLCWWMAIGAL